MNPLDALYQNDLSLKRDSCCLRKWYLCDSFSQILNLSLTSIPSLHPGLHVHSAFASFSPCSPPFLPDSCPHSPFQPLPSSQAPVSSNDDLSPNKILKLWISLGLPKKNSIQITGDSSLHQIRLAMTIAMHCAGKKCKYRWSQLRCRRYQHRLSDNHQTELLITMTKMIWWVFC